MDDLLELFFPFGDYTTFFTLVGFGLVLLYSRDGRILTWFHLDLLMIMAWVPLTDYEVGDLDVTMILGWLPLFYWIPRLLYLFVRMPEPVAMPRLNVRGLKWLTGIALAYVVMLTLVSPMPFGDFGEKKYHLSDSAMIGYRGANRILEGELPYAPESAGWGKVYPYGPAYYVLYVPFAHFFPETDPERSYCLGARLLAILLASGGAIGLYLLGRHLSGPRAGWGWALFWLACHYVHNSAYWSQSSHMLPGVFTILGLAAMARSPVVSGGMLGLVTACAYYPVLFFPTWAKGSGKVIRFGIAFSVVLGAAFLPVLLAEDGIKRFLNHFIWMEGSLLGRSVSDRWSPWAQHPYLLPVRFMLMPVFALIVVFVFWRAWRHPMCLRRAAFGSALIVASMGVWREHAPGRYHLWLFPLLLIACLWPAPAADSTEQEPVTDA